LHKKKEYLVWSSLSFQAIVIQQLDGNKKREEKVLGNSLLSPSFLTSNGKCSVALYFSLALKRCYKKLRNLVIFLWLFPD